MNKFTRTTGVKILLLLLSFASGTEINDVTDNLGILPIKLGPAKLQTSQHTFLHYYDLKTLYEEFKQLNYQYSKILGNNNNLYYNETYNYCKIINYTKDMIKRKINNIDVHANTRFKRGIINGLGSVIKVITGNLDADDGIKYDRIIEQIKNNQVSLQNQLKEQYSISNQIINNFNDTVRDIQFNQLELKRKLLQIKEIIRMGYNHNSNVLAIKDLLNQLQIVYSIIVSILQNIETSLTFCKLRTLHPSIIKSDEFLEELKKINDHYKNRLPFQVKYENILKFEALLKVDCKINSGEIIYFLTLPINAEENYDLYYLHPLPAKNKYKFLTIVPNIKYLLKSSTTNVIIPLNDICTKGSLYQCHIELLSHQKINCEREVLLNQTTKCCTYVELAVQESHIDYIPEISKLLLVFPNKEKIFISNGKGSESKTLQGIFLVDPGNDKIMYKNEVVNFVSTSNGQPDILRAIDFVLPEGSSPNFTVNLRNLRLKDINRNPMVPLITKPVDASNNHTLLWIVYFTLVAVIVIVLLVFFLRKTFTFQKTPQKDQEPRTSKAPTTLPRKEVRF